MKKLLVLLVSVLMALSLCACTPKKDPEPEPVDLDSLTYDEASAYVYDACFNEFFAIYSEAKQTKDVDEKHALMALAEGKLMEAAVMLPTTTQGGSYSLSRVAPYTVDFTLWGSDADRYHQAIVATEFIKTEDRDHLKAKWAELKGSGTYEAYVKDYLTGKGYTLKDTYSLGYTSDPVTWDVLSTSRAADTDAIINTFDGLYEYDVEGIAQPALATGYSVSEDGLTYTFTIREGVKWVDSQGRELGEVTADDWVAGAQHMMDAQGGLEYLVDGEGGCNIVGAHDYIYGVITDFSQVGVKAVDKYTLQYTLVEECPFFMTMLGYSIFAPLNREYFESLGGKFGAEWDASATTFGTSSDTIAYNGPYLVTNATEKSKIVFSANPTYWNADNINVKTMNWLFNDGSDVTKAYEDAKAGTIDGVALTTSTIENAKADGLFNDFAYISSTNATTYMGFINLNRTAYANTADENTVVSPKANDDAAKEKTKAALLNVHFRRALLFSMDRLANNAQKKGDELAATNLRNSYTPWNFSFLEKDVTVNVNGTPTTFKNGTSYGEMMQYQIDKDGVAIKVYDPAADNGGDGYDGWYNVANAQAELALAVEELKAQGVEISAENPVHVDLPYASNSEVYTNCAQAYKQSVEAATGGAIILDLVACADYNEWYYAGYYTDYGYEANYDVYDLSGWGPDYGDPSTYLDTMLPEYAGYMVKCFGLY